MEKREASVTGYVVMALLVVAVVMFGALGTVDYLAERDRQMGELASDVRLMAEQLSASLALPVWNFDQSQVDKILEGAIQDPEVQGVRLEMDVVSGGKKTERVYSRGRDAKGVVVADGAFATGDTLSEAREIFAFDDPEHQVRVGKVTAYVTQRFVVQDLKKQWWEKIGIFCAFGLVLALGLAWLMWRIVLKPVLVIEQYARGVSSGAEPAMMNGGVKFRGELERLRVSMEKMVELLGAQLRFEELVAGISSLLVAARPGNVDGVLERALKQIGEKLDAGRVVLGQRDGETGEMVARAGFRVGGPAFPERLVISERYPVLWKVLLRGEVSHIRDTVKLGEEAAVDRKHFLEIGIKSQVTAPVLVEGKLEFILAVACVEHQVEWHEEAIARIRVLAEVLATTVMRCEAEEAARAQAGRVRALAAELTRSEERQRRELAVILHDEVGQNLFAATTQLVSVRNRAEGVREDVEKTLSLLDQIARDTRELTFELCPPVLYQMGLGAALKRLAELFGERYGVACSVEGEGNGPADLNVRGLAYQSVRELLANVAKHAQAKTVRVKLSENGGEMRIEVRDDGVGFDVRAMGRGGGGFGLFALRERMELLGGRFGIVSSPGGGSCAEIYLPLESASVGVMP